MSCSVIHNLLLLLLLEGRRLVLLSDKWEELLSEAFSCKDPVSLSACRVVRMACLVASQGNASEFRRRQLLADVGPKL